MNLKWKPEMTLLGAGGNSPHVEILEADSGETRRLVGLSPGHSAYAIDIDVDDGSIAVGTKGGLIRLISGIYDQGTDDPVPNQELVQGAPILSVCWTNNSYLAVSDTAGRCLLWRKNNEYLPQPLEVMEGNICCLLNLSDGQLAGLSSKGKLHFWEPLKGQLVRAIDLPAPPPMSALVRVFYWSAEQALVCPGTGGEMTIYDPKADDFRHLKAHEGPFYAISVWGENLLTVGMKDNRMRIWPAGSDKPLYDLEAPEGVISAGLTGFSLDKLILVDTQGTASIYTVEEGALQLMNSLPGKDYRTVITPAPEKIQAFYANQKEAEVKQIITEIQEKMGRAPHDVVERLHARLIDLGYNQVSLAFRAKEAEQQRNIGEALGFYSSLIGILPQDTLTVCTWMERYATLLQKAWQIHEADGVWKHILSLNANYPFLEDREKVAQIAGLLEHNDCLIQPDIPIDQIIESASVIGKQFLGRYVIKSQHPEPCGRMKLDPASLAEKYNQVRRDRGNELLPAAATEHIWCLSRKEINEVKIVTFGDGANNSVRGLQFALQILPGDLGTVVIPMTIFDWRENGKGSGIQEENERASRALKGIRNKAVSNPYLAAVHSTVKHALQRLLNESIPQRSIQ